MKKLSDFLKEDNIYRQKHASKIRSLMEKLATGSSSSNFNKDTSSPVPWKIIIPVGLVFIIVVGGLVWIVRRRKIQKAS